MVGHSCSLPDGQGYVRNCLSMYSPKTVAFSTLTHRVT